MNPYAVQLGNRDPLEVIAATGNKLRQALDTLGPKGLEQALAPGKWNAGQILCHLADTELAFSFRLRQALAEDHHVIQPFDQDKWARGYSAADARDAVGVFSAVRNWNLRLLKTVKPGEMAKPVTHPERGQETFKTLVETMAGHDLNHLKQIEGIAAKAGAGR